MKKSKPQKRGDSPKGLTLWQLSKALGVEHKQLRIEAKRPGFPKKRASGYGVEEVRAWRDKNIRKRKPDAGGALAAPPVSDDQWADGLGSTSQSGRQSLARADDPFILDLMSGKADALTIANAAMQMASRRVGVDSVDGSLGGMALDGLKKSIAELRQTENDYIKLNLLKKELLLRTDVERFLATCCSRFVRCLERLENSIATEFGAWLADPVIRGMGADDRARRVRDYVAAECRVVRTQESGEARRMMIDGRGPEEDEEDGGEGEDESQEQPGEDLQAGDVRQ